MKMEANFCHPCGKTNVVAQAGREMKRSISAGQLGYKTVALVAGWHVVVGVQPGLALGRSVPGLGS